MLDLWLEQESQIEKTAAQQFEELAEKIAVEGAEPGVGLEPVKPDGYTWESSNYSEEVRSPEAADQLLKRELTGRVVDEIPKTDVQQTPPRAINTPNGRAEDRVPTVEKLKKAAAATEERNRQRWKDVGVAGGLAGGGALAGLGVQRAYRDMRTGSALRKAVTDGAPSVNLKIIKGKRWPGAVLGGMAGLGLYGAHKLRQKSKTSSLKEAMVKAAGISQSKRESLSSKQFAVPLSKAQKIGVAGEIKGEAKGKYPVDTLKRARNALARVSQFGTPSERSAVRSKVYSKYPNLRSGFEERHAGQSPTAKQNIRKVEQGGIGKASSLKEVMVKAASDGKVRTLEDWGALSKLAARPIEALPIDKAEEVRQARLMGGIGGGALGMLGGGLLGSAVGSIGGRRGGSIGGLVGALGGTGLGAYLGGRHSRMAAEATPEEVFQARANLREAEDRYGRGELEDKSRLLATLMAANETMRRTGRKGISSDYLARDRPGSFVPHRTEYEFGNPHDLFGRGGSNVKTVYRRVPREE